MYFFCDYWSEMLCARFNVPPIRAGMRDTCMNPCVEFLMFKIVFYKIFDHAWDQVYNKYGIFFARL